MRRLDVRAVRGYNSLERLKGYAGVKIAKDIAVADPGLLLSRIFDVSSVKKKYKLGIIPHYVDCNSPLLDKIKVDNSVILDICQPPEVLAFQIAECENIISSAMHGLIAADSFGIPNIRMIVTDGLTGGDYKFNDYYSAFGIQNHARVDLRQQSFTDNDLEQLRSQYAIGREQVISMQNALIKAFPYKETGYAA